MADNIQDNHQDNHVNLDNIKDTDLKAKLSSFSIEDKKNLKLIKNAIITIITCVVLFFLLTILRSFIAGNLSENTLMIEQIIKMVQYLFLFFIIISAFIIAFGLSKISELGYDKLTLSMEEGSADFFNRNIAKVMKKIKQ